MQSEIIHLTSTTSLSGHPLSTVLRENCCKEKDLYKPEKSRAYRIYTRALAGIITLVILKVQIHYSTLEVSVKG